MGRVVMHVLLVVFGCLGFAAVVGTLGTVGFVACVEYGHRRRARSHAGGVVGGPVGEQVIRDLEAQDAYYRALDRGHRP